LHVPAFGDQNTPKQFVDIAAGSDYERRLLRSRSNRTGREGCHRSREEEECLTRIGFRLTRTIDPMSPLHPPSARQWIFDSALGTRPSDRKRSLIEAYLACQGRFGRNIRRGRMSDGRWEGNWHSLQDGNPPEPWRRKSTALCFWPHSNSGLVPMSGYRTWGIGPVSKRDAIRSQRLVRRSRSPVSGFLLSGFLFPILAIGGLVGVDFRGFGSLAVLTVGPWVTRENTSSHKFVVLCDEAIVQVGAPCPSIHCTRTKENVREKDNRCPVFRCRCCHGVHSSNDGPVRRCA